MSSLKAKKRKTLETRKKTKKRLKKLGLDHTYSVGWNKHVTVYPGVQYAYATHCSLLNIQIDTYTYKYKCELYIYI